jgi:hypothetical protein
MPSLTRQEPEREGHSIPVKAPCFLSTLGTARESVMQVISDPACGAAGSSSSTHRERSRA